MNGVQFEGDGDEVESVKVRREGPEKKKRAECAPRTVKALRSLGGLLCASLGAVTFALMSLAGELAARHIRNPFVIVTVRGAVQAVLGVAVFVVQKAWEVYRKRRRQKWGGREEVVGVGSLLGPPNRRELIYLWGGRALLGGMSANVYIFLLTQLPLADVSSLNSLIPILAALLGRLWLRERLHWLTWLAGVLTVVGALIIASPPFLAPVLSPLGLEPSGLDAMDRPVLSRPAAVALAVLRSLAGATDLVCVRKIRHVPMCVLVFAHGASACLIAVIVMLSWSVMRPSISELSGVPLWEGWGMSVLMGGCAFGAQAFFTVSLMLEKAGPAAFAMVLDVPISFVLQKEIMATGLGAGSLVGGSLIVVSVLLLFAVKLYCSPPSPPGSASEAPGSSTLDEESRGGEAEREGERRDGTKLSGREVLVSSRHEGRDPTAAPPLREDDSNSLE